MKSEPDRLAIELIQHVDLLLGGESVGLDVEAEEYLLNDLMEHVVCSASAIRSVREHLRVSGPAPSNLKNRLPQVAKWVKDCCDDVVQELEGIEASNEGVTTVAMTVAGTGGAGTAAAVGGVMIGGAAGVAPVVSTLIATGGIAGPILFGGGIALYLLRKNKSARNKQIIAGAKRLSVAIANRDKPV
ncbi:hypothetical protein [Erythrobacter crassostreae]|uniref:Uncharacterized protein n=1 Tax=Erythrobacter crassostreae TaxID=2828328 RepID=A0A9X1F3T9_9SPHN|nr:hypothetical protein [Erythrobacter crassostrea]MBV7258988.1 hypothetical protein [Erythrobacter crassostrea]